MIKERCAVKTETRNPRNDLMSLTFMSCTLLMLASVMHMWSHWSEISALFGPSRAAGTLAAVTGAACVVSWWLNTGNE